MKTISLEPLRAEDKNQFILDNQEAFRYGATEEFGLRDEHYEEDGEIISRTTIEKAITDGEAYRIICDGEAAGGAPRHRHAHGVLLQIRRARLPD